MARAWNAYYKGEELKQIKVLDEYAPLVLSGTPYNGKQSGDFLSLNTAPATTAALLQPA